MNRLIKVMLMLGLLVSLAVAEEPRYQTIGPARVYTTDGDFAQVKENLVWTIESRGLVISYTSHASDMLDRTAEAVGVEQAVYGDAEIILFCKADLSHALVAASPHNLTLCPYSIAAYTLAGEPDRVYLSMPRPFTKEPATEPITALLHGIILDTINGGF